MSRLGRFPLPSPPPLDDPWEPMDVYRAEQRLERRRRLHGLPPRSEREVLDAAARRQPQFGGNGDKRTFRGLA